MGTPINVGRCVPPIRVLSPDYIIKYETNENWYH